MDKNNLFEKLYINEKITKNQGNIVKKKLKGVIPQLENKICKIKKTIKGTGFFTKIPYPNKFHLLPVLITNNHILGNEDLSISNIINLTLNDGKEKRSLKIDELRKKFTDKKLDVTIIEIKPKEDGINDFLDLDDDFDNEKYRENEDIYILQYCNGENSSLSFGKLKKIQEEIINHDCSTIQGSSGSPILLIKNNKVFGVHKGAQKYDPFNKGTLIKFAIEEFNKKYPHYPHHSIEMILDNNEKEDIYILNYSI